MHTAYCKLHMAHFILHTSYCTLQTAHFKLHTSNCTMHSATRSMQTSHCPLQTTLHTVNSTMRIVHCKLDNARFKLPTACFTLSTGKSLTFRGTVYEASELIKSHKCSDPLCDTQLLKVRPHCICIVTRGGIYGET